ncbi:MAG TPA: PfkB family carbohydrate kinase, partial [Polyangiaceae bacterium]
HLIRAYGPPRFLADLDAARFDVLFPNREEAEAMTSEREPHAAAVALRRVSPVVVLKLGGDGCLVAWGDRLDHLPAAVARVIDTTGAGDAFAAAFAVEYATNGDPMAAARAATFAAAAQVERIGAR